MNKKQTILCRPQWSLATSFWFCIGVLAVLVPTVLLAVRESVWVKLELVTGILAVLMFVYFSILLHQGVRFNDSRRAVVDWPKSSPQEILISA